MLSFLILIHGKKSQSIFFPMLETKMKKKRTFYKKKSLSDWFLLFCLTALNYLIRYFFFLRFSNKKMSRSNPNKKIQQI